MAEKKTYVATRTVQFNGQEYPAAATIELGEKDALPLLERGAIVTLKEANARSAAIIANDPAKARERIAELEKQNDDLVKKLADAHAQIRGCEDVIRETEAARDQYQAELFTMKQNSSDQKPVAKSRSKK